MNYIKPYVEIESNKGVNIPMEQSPKKTTTLLDEYDENSLLTEE